MPERKSGGHIQGRKVTLVVALEPGLRKLIEDEADASPERNMSDVARGALREYYGFDRDEEVPNG